MSLSLTSQLLLVLVAVVGPQTSTGAVQREQASDAILERVILREINDRDPEVCLFLSADSLYTYVEPSARLLERLRRRKPGLRPASDPACVNLIERVWIGPIQWIDDRTAEVSAGDFAVTLAGRPRYLVKRNWLGRWRVIRVSPAE